MTHSAWWWREHVAALILAGVATPLELKTGEIPNALAIGGFAFGCAAAVLDGDWATAAHDALAPGDQQRDERQREAEDVRHLKLFSVLALVLGAVDTLVLWGFMASAFVFTFARSRRDLGLSEVPTSPVMLLGILVVVFAATR